MVTVKEKKFRGISKNPSILGFGCMRFPTKNGEIDEELATDMIDYAYQNGVTYFDTAWPYHEGKSELFIGKALKKYPRESFYLADKMPIWATKDLEDIKNLFNEQLKKCQVEYFDYYLLHAMNKERFLEYQKPGVIQFFYDLKKKGIIKHLGISFHDTPNVLAQILDTFDLDFVQIQLNYLDWDYQNAKKQYEIIESHNLPIIIMEPVRGGALADLGQEPNQVLLNSNDEVSIASWAIRYAMSKDMVMCVLSGMSTFDQVKDNIKTASPLKLLNSDEQKVLNEALSIFLNTNIIPCTGCRYCMDCPMGVDIPLNFKQYNTYKITRRAESFINWYLECDTNASRCVACKKCLDKCPQKIDIPGKLKTINDFVTNK